MHALMYEEIRARCLPGVEPALVTAFAALPAAIEEASGARRRVQLLHVARQLFQRRAPPATVVPPERAKQPLACNTELRVFGLGVIGMEMQGSPTRPRIARSLRRCYCFDWVCRSTDKPGTEG